MHRQAKCDQALLRWVGEGHWLLVGLTSRRGTQEGRPNYQFPERLPQGNRAETAPGLHTGARRSTRIHAHYITQLVQDCGK